MASQICDSQGSKSLFYGLLEYVLKTPSHWPTREAAAKVWCRAAVPALPWDTALPPPGGISFEWLCVAWSLEAEGTAKPHKSRPPPPSSAISSHHHGHQVGAVVVDRAALGH